MSAEISYTFYLASRLIKVDPKRNRQKSILYFVLSWSVPLVTVSICIVLNYSTPNLIQYGRNAVVESNSCWINHFSSAVVVFLLPIATSALIQSVFFIIVFSLLCTINRRKGNERVGDKNTPYLRILFAFYIASHIMWLFGFLALLINTNWAWYPFVILQSTQGLILFIGFFGTKKVLMLYISKLPSKSCLSNKFTLSSSTKRSDM